MLRLFYFYSIYVKPSISFLFFHFAGIYRTFPCFICASICAEAQLRWCSQLFAYCYSLATSFKFSHYNSLTLKQMKIIHVISILHWDSSKISNNAILSNICCYLITDLLKVCACRIFVLKIIKSGCINPISHLRTMILHDSLCCETLHTAYEYIGLLMNY